MNREKRCQCGDGQEAHEGGTGACIICFWLPTEGQPCREFRLVEDSEKEARTKHVIQRLDKRNEARGVAIGIIGDYKRAKRTEEEQARRVEKDNLDLFGPER